MLKDIIKGTLPDQRRFLLCRIGGLDVTTAKKNVGIPEGTYNRWTGQERFKSIYRQLPELQEKYKLEAINLLRRDNQMSAVLLEAEIIQKLREEVDSGELVLAKTNLGREVYSKLMNDLDNQPKVVSNTWEQRILAIQGSPIQQLTEGGTIDGTFSETDSSQQEQYEESSLDPPSS
ncbi:MAG: hypothetical protein RBS96_06695 [Dehalococcoidales bacterium]|jgi:hypothetical protein|nr:hypothetical protein [Dehalococcoidales bacterium]